MFTDPCYLMHNPEYIAARNHHMSTAHIYPLPQDVVVVDMNSLTLTQLKALIASMP